MTIIRVLLVDDNRSFARAARIFFDGLAGVKVVGSALSGEEAVPLVDALAPDLIVMDLAMPGIGGLEATRRIKRRTEAPKVLILTLHNTQTYRLQSLQAGADSFMAKDDLVTQLPIFLASTFPSTADGHVLTSPVCTALPEPQVDAMLGEGGNGCYRY